MSFPNYSKQMCLLIISFFIFERKNTISNIPFEHLGKSEMLAITEYDDFFSGRL